MSQPPDIRALYAAFDLFPSSKGAATHIHQMVQAMQGQLGRTQLCVLGHEKLPEWQEEDSGLRIKRFASTIPNFLRRTQAWAGWLFQERQQLQQLELIHFRDPWSGIPLIQNAEGIKVVYEVNGLPSIELPYRYPHLTQQTLGKIRQWEQICLDRADLIVVPAQTINLNLQKRGVAKHKIQVISNGVDRVPENLPRPEQAPAQYLLYFGALQPWQGIPDLFKAFANLSDYENLKLVILSSTKRRHSKAYRKLAEKMGIGERIHWEYQVSRGEVQAWLTHAELSVAPLRACSRNLEQGCSPLKVLESMAAGTPVVASDLPAIREIALHGENALLVPPNRPASLSRAIRKLLDLPELRKKIGLQGKKLVEGEFLWEFKRAELQQSYEKLLS